MPGLRVLVLDLWVVEEVSITVLDMLSDLHRVVVRSSVEMRLAAVPPNAAAVPQRRQWLRDLRDQGRVQP